MKTSEKVYTAIVICFAIFCIMAIAVLQLISIPVISNPNSLRVLNFVTALLVIYALVLSITSFVNLKRHEMETVSTVIQIVLMTLMVYGIPFAIWGTILLIHRRRSEAIPSETSC